jgi:protein gp37
MNTSGIEWILNDDGSKGFTCNPVVGCDEHSPGCKNCWAKELVATRMVNNPKLPMYHDLARVTDGGKSQWTGVVKLVPERLKDIVALGRARKRKDGKLVPFGSRVFICDMSDLFHDEVPFEYIAACFGAMACAQNHLFYVLTKRAERAVEWSKWIVDEGAELVASVGEEPGPTASAEGSACLFYAHDFGIKHTNREAADLFNTTPWPLPNVAFGVTVEDRRYGVPRLGLARQFPAQWHWVSVEPQLEDLGDVDFAGFDLIVNGGEAGPDSRPFDLQWARSVRDAARKAGMRYFMKQAGDNVIDNGVPLDLRKKGNDLSALPEDLRIRENLPMPTGNDR